MTASPSEVLKRTQSDLRALWSVPAATGQTPRARACTTNLVVVTSAPLAQRWVAIVDDVLLSLPARAILVGLDPEGPDGLEATTSAVCAPSDKGEQAVCSERISLVARGAVCSRVASCVATLCATDVPMTLVWPGHLSAEHPAFAAIASDADRIVFDGDMDTEDSAGSPAGIARLVERVAVVHTCAAGRASKTTPGVADLAWTRLAPWLEYCARMFDGPALPALATEITRLELAQAGPPGTALGSEAALLLGWLATHLGWDARARESALPRLVRPDGGQLDVILRADPAAATCREALLSVRIEAGTRQLVMCGTVAREAGEPDAATWVLDVTSRGDRKRIEQHVRLRGGERARLLERTLHRPPHDVALTESVAWIASLGMGRLTCR